MRRLLGGLRHWLREYVFGKVGHTSATDAERAESEKNLSWP